MESEAQTGLKQYTASRHIRPFNLVEESSYSVGTQPRFRRQSYKEILAFI